MIAQALKTMQQAPGVIAVLVARSFALLRVRESKANRGRWVDAIVEIAGGDDDQAGAWCAYFGWACWYIAGLVLGCELETRTSGGVIRSWHLATDAERVEGRPEPGDLMCLVRDPRHLALVRNGGTVPGHMEIVRRVREDGSLDTIGGNTTSSESAEGDGVYIHRETYTLNDPRLVGFIRPKLRRLK